MTIINIIIDRKGNNRFPNNDNIMTHVLNLVKFMKVNNYSKYYETILQSI